jgi:hypothetical protein
MSEQHRRQRRQEWVEERFGRYARRVHRLLYSCDGCGGALHQTHNYVLYGNVCWTCWRLNQRHGAVMASHWWEVKEAWEKETHGWFWLMVPIILAALMMLYMLRLVSRRL